MPSPTLYQIRVVDGLDDWGWGVIVNVMKQPSQSNAKSAVIAPSPTVSAAAAAPLSTTAYLVDTLLLCSPAVVDGQAVREGSAVAPLVLRPCAMEGHGEMHVPLGWAGRNACGKLARHTWSGGHAAGVNSAPSAAPLGTRGTRCRW
ncbi:unnamed protein product [Closterium sp. NIES-54]